MPHAQKESHDHSTFSKKNKKEKLKQSLLKKNALSAAEALAEANASNATKGPAPGLAEGFGEYEVGCEADKEYTTFNPKKRNKKHLKEDLRRKEDEKKRQEKDALEAAARIERGEISESSSSEEVEEEEVTIELLIYICECCRKKFATKNQFINHSNSWKHRDNAAPYEEFGMIVTGVALKDEGVEDDGEGDGDDNDDIVFVGKDDEESDYDSELDGEEGEGVVEEQEEEEEEEYYEKPKTSGFAALMDDSSSSEEEEVEEGEEEQKPLATTASETAASPFIPDEDDEDDAIDLDSLILQNQLIQNEIDALNAAKLLANPPPPPPPQTDTSQVDALTQPSWMLPTTDNRSKELLQLKNRLKQKLHLKGLTPSEIETYAEDAVGMGKTLLQQVMSAQADQLSERLAAYKKHKAENRLINREFALAKGNNKALPAQYSRKQDAAHDDRLRENVHHTGSHYVGQQASSMRFGRIAGLSARHSSQGARLQAKRMDARANVVNSSKEGGAGKKSKMKRRGEAGGSKKTGGGKSEE